MSHAATIEQQNQIKVELRPLQRSLDLFITIFTYLLTAEMLINIISNDMQQLVSTCILITGFLCSRVFLRNNNNEQAIVFLCIVFYVVGFYNAVVIGNYITCYLILIVAPVITSILLETLWLKIVIISCSILLFIFCNWLMDLPLFSNYYYFYGMIASSLLMLHFYNKIARLTKEKNALIANLKEKNDEVIMFSNMMSHDLKAPLSSIQGFSQILQDDFCSKNTRAHEMLGYILQGVDSLKTLINDLHKYSKYSFQEVSFKNIEFTSLMKRLIDNFKFEIDQRNIEISLSNLSNLHGHEESLFLLFQNLLSNAIKFHPKDDDHIAKIEIHQESKNGMDIITVRDNGIGLDQSKAKDIFLPFKRFHSSDEYEGTGLGMSIVSKIVEKHQGYISSQSTLGEGTSITVSLPQKQA